MCEFGSKASTGLSVGNPLTENDLKILRGFKNIRNKFAHSVNVDFSKEEIIKIVKNIHASWVEMAKAIASKTELPINIESLKSAAEYFEEEPEACHGFLLGIFTIYQAYFHRKHDIVKALDSET